MLINLENYGERNRITSDSGVLNPPSSEDEYPAGASLYPQKNLNWRHPLPDDSWSPTGWFYLAKVIKQSA
jgi:hypothetical protein